MSIAKTIWVLATAVVFSVAASGAELSPTYQKCNDKAFSNIDFSDCGGAEIKRQEKRLNTVWKKVLACFDDSDETTRDAKQSLLAEQRLWIKWKDTACKFYYPQTAKAANTGFAGREGEAIHYGACKAGIIAERADFFEDFAKECR